MVIIRVNLVLLVASLTFGVVYGQTPPLPAPRQVPTPAPPQFPAEEALSLENDGADIDFPPVPEPLPHPVEALPLPEEAIPDAQVRSEPTLAPDVESAAEPDANGLPDQSQLVSILKGKLPAENETLPVSDAPEWFQEMMQRIVRENVPNKYIQEKDWGMTDKRWDGLHVHRQGTLRWSTKRKWKEVNHGTWKRYEVTQISPEENLTMRIENIRDAGGGKVGFDVRLTSRLHVSGRLAKWAKGVQIYNISADADAYVQLQMQCAVGIKLDITRFPPDVLLTPTVTQADIEVQEFQLQQLSKLRGPLVKELSGSVHRALLEKIDEKRDQLPSKINRQIAKNQDKLRLSLADFAAERWQSLTQTSPDGSEGDDDATEDGSSDGWESRDGPLRSARRIVVSRTYDEPTNAGKSANREPVQLLDLVPPDGGTMR